MNSQLPTADAPVKAPSSPPLIAGSLLAIAAATVMGLTLSAQQAAPPAQTSSQQPPEIVGRITGDPGAPPRYAVPDFVAATPAAAEIGRMLGQVLWDDLNFEREFYMIPRDTYKTIPVAPTPDRIPFAAWRELGADGLVFGTVELKGNDVVVRVRVFNVRTGDSVIAQEYSSTTRSARRIAHTISNLIHDQQRGLKGVALTKLAFISTRQRQSLLGTVENRNAKEVYVSDYDGANQQQITTTKQLNLSPSWSADASAIAYTAYRGGGQPTILISHIFKGILQELTKTEGSHKLPVYSPDGKRIAYETTRDGNVDIYVANVDGSNVRRITNHPDTDGTPTWSPGGNQIAFTSDRFSPGRPQLFIMDADGTGVQRLPIPESQADRATWAPAPYNEIAYSGWTGSGWDIKVYDLTTRETRSLTFGEGSNESPSYSPTGRHIAFQSSRGSGRFQIYTIGRDGNGLRQITRDGDNTMPDWSN
jgi:TolB protein